MVYLGVILEDWMDSGEDQWECSQPRWVVEPLGVGGGTDPREVLDPTAQGRGLLPAASEGGPLHRQTRLLPRTPAPRAAGLTPRIAEAESLERRRRDLVLRQVQGDGPSSPAPGSQPEKPRSCLATSPGETSWDRCSPGPL